jgi:hypothetical protein
MAEKRANSFETAAKHWKNMPEYVSEDLRPYKTLPVHFASEEAIAAFAALVGQKVHKKSKCIWFPPAEIGHFADKSYVDEPFDPFNPSIEKEK